MVTRSWLLHEFGMTYEESELMKAYIPKVYLKLQEDFLYYLDVQGQLKKLEEMGHKYNSLIKKWKMKKVYAKPFRFPLEINLKQLSEVSGPYLFGLLIHEPHVATSIIHKVIHTALRTLTPLTDLQWQQVQVTINLQALSRLPFYNFNTPQVGCLLLLQGTLMALTSPIKYFRSTIFHCVELSCQNSKHNIYGNWSCLPSQCYLCGGSIKEVPQAHDVGEQVIGLLIQSSTLNDYIFDKKTVPICFQDELISGLELGSCYDIAGHLGPSFFYAWSVQSRTLQLQQNSFNTLPSKLGQLHAWISQICPNSPWAFVVAVSSCLAADLYPTSAFLQLKLGLILSLASQVSSRPIPILGVGEDTCVINHLMIRACLLAQHCLMFSCPSVSGPVGGLARWDEKGYRWFEAGPLILASYGVCYLGDWSKFKQRNVQITILSALESGQVSFDVQGSGTQGPTLSVPTFPLHSAIWTYHSLIPQNKKQPQQHSSLQTLINVFGIPFVTDDTKSFGNIATHMLSRKVHGPQEQDTIIPTHELKEYITMVAAMHVTMSNEARELIRGYFVASRRVRPSCLPVGAVSTIAALSEAHARLSLRNSVLSYDVVAVLRLYEEAMFKLYGPSYILPPPFSSSCQIDLPLPIQIHNELKEFNTWIDNYIKSLAGSSFTPCNSQE